jgi:hypothetical protein
MSALPPPSLTAAIVQLARARTKAGVATSAANRLHAKMPRALPTTEAERCDAVAELERAYLLATRAAQGERMAALRCLRTIEDLAAREGESGLFSRGRAAIDAAAAEEEELMAEGGGASDEAQRADGASPLPAAVSDGATGAAAAAAAASPHPYGTASGWGASDAGEEDSERGDGDEGEEEGEEGEDLGASEHPSDSELASERGFDEEIAGSDVEAEGDDLDAEYGGGESEAGESMQQGEYEDGEEEGDSAYGDDADGEEGDEVEDESASEAGGGGAYGDHE